jgi:hypothetical protein
VCVAATECQPAAQVATCDAGGPDGAGSTQFVTAGAPGETLPSPGSQVGAGGDGGSDGSTGVVVAVVIILLVLAALVAFVVRKRRQNARAAAGTDTATSLRTSGSSSGTQLRYYGDAPPRTRSTNGVHRSRQASRAASRSHLRHGGTAAAAAAPLAYGQAHPQGGGSWGVGGYGSTRDGRYQVVDNYSPAPTGAPQVPGAPSPDSSYHSLAMDTSYQELSMKQASASPAPSPYQAASSVPARRATDAYHSPPAPADANVASSPVGGYVDFVRPSPSPGGPVQPGYRAGGARSMYASTTAVDTYTPTLMMQRNTHSNTFDIMYAPDT